MHTTTSPLTVFVFSGHGCQWPGMGAKLMETEPEFLATLERFDEYIRIQAGWSLFDFLRTEEQDDRWNDLAHVQPAIVAYEVALAQVWLSRGVMPDFVLGQSLGEVAAACVSGALTEADAARVILACCQAQKDGKEGSLMVVGLGAKEAAGVAEQYKGEIFVAGSLSPRFSVLGGDNSILKTVGRELRNDGILSQRIKIPAATHTPYVERSSGALRKALTSIAPRPETIPLYSSVTGERMRGSSMHAEHWVDLVVKPMAFREATEKIITTAPHYLYRGQPACHFIRYVRGPDRSPC